MLSSDEANIPEGSLASLHCDPGKSLEPHESQIENQEVPLSELDNEDKGPVGNACDDFKIYPGLL